MDAPTVHSLALYTSLEKGRNGAPTHTAPRTHDRNGLIMKLEWTFGAFGNHLGIWTGNVSAVYLGMLDAPPVHQGAHP